MWLLYLVISVAIILDRITKVMVINNMELFQSISFIKGVLSFTYVRNTGAAFSMLSSSNILLGVVSCAVVIAGLIFIHYKKLDNKFLLIYAGMIIGGAIGNVIDRFVYQYVIDFLDVQFMEFAVFNIADCFIVVGSILLACYIMLLDGKKEEVNTGGKD